MKELKEACRGVVRLEPMLCLYSELVRYYLAVLTGAHRTTGKLLSVLANIFTELAQKVYCLLLALTGHWSLSETELLSVNRYCLQHYQLVDFKTNFPTSVLICPLLCLPLCYHSTGFLSAPGAYGRRRW